MSAGRISSRYFVLSRAVVGAGAVAIVVLIQSGAAALGHAQALPVLNLNADASRLAVLGVDQHHVGDVNRPLALDHAARLLAGRGLGGALVALDDVEALDVDPLLLGLHPQHPAALAAVLAADHDDLVVSPDPCRHGYSTSGARETIFMKLRSRSSRATGPKMRVPRGLFCASISTAAFSSKAM